MADSAAKPIQPVLAPQRRSRLFQSLRTLRRLPIIPVFLLALVVFCGVMAPWIAPHNPERGRLTDRNLPPAWMSEGSATYLLGTDPWGGIS